MSVINCAEFTDFFIIGKNLCFYIVLNLVNIMPAFIKIVENILLKLYLYVN